MGDIGFPWRGVVGMNLKEWNVNTATVFIQVNQCIE